MWLFYVLPLSLWCLGKQGVAPRTSDIDAPTFLLHLTLQAKINVLTL